TLFADFDNDGWRDLLITNGYRKDITDLDFISYRDDFSMFGGNDQERLRKFRASSEKLPGVHKPDFLFRNNGGDQPGNLTFTNKAPDWGLTDLNYTNGAAYADFDGDGDLDLVMNTLNEEALVYRNRLEEIREKGEGKKEKRGNFLRVKLAGEPGNREGLGARMDVFFGENRLFAEHALQRGYKSTVENVLHFGLGAATRVDSLTLTWPGGRRQVLRNLKPNQVLTLHEDQATLLPLVPNSKLPALFADVTAGSGLNFGHQENGFLDFKHQPTLCRTHSRIGPGLAVGDVNGDGLDDVYVAGAANKPGGLFLQKSDGTFFQKNRSATPKPAEELGVLLFDADNDGDLDLYTATGSSEFAEGSEALRDVLYLNDGHGGLTPAPTNTLPDVRSSGSMVIAADFDRDGDLDLFVGGRVRPGHYPLAARSQLLRNDSPRAGFTDITPPALRDAGLVTAALWTDYDNDGCPELLLAGEWMPLTFFKNEKGRFIHHSLFTIQHSTGWWNSLAAGDFDNDGDVDYVAGNLGLNSKYQARPGQPVRLYAKDYDQNGTTDAILTHYLGGKEVPTHPRNVLTDQLVGIKKLTTTYARYGKMGFHDLLKSGDLEGATVLEADQLASVFLENKGAGNFEIHPLPTLAQIAPMNGMQVLDFDHDGHLDLLAVGNDYSPESLTGRYDGSIGWLLRGDGRGAFTPVPARQSGLALTGDCKSLVEVLSPDGKPRFVVGKNNDSLRVLALRINPTERLLRPAPGDVAALLKLTNGHTRRVEFYRGSGYLSQSTRVVRLGKEVKEVVLVNGKGMRRWVKF
ncbi:MAG: VCBS repeat-containing protein, partial [Sphingobacteriaceae bacterium]|nr:VCBS repeat-containing protein [Cytophagaceae bacterium]